MAKTLSKILKTFEKTKSELEGFITDVTQRLTENHKVIHRLEDENDALRKESAKALQVYKNIDDLINT